MALGLSSCMGRHHRDRRMSFILFQEEKMVVTRQNVKGINEIQINI